jgi:hypothetical protein
LLGGLAKRQGVGDEELTTSADMEIAEVPADIVIDEPGYVPFEGSRTARRMKEEAEAAAKLPPPEPEPEPEVLPELDWGTPEEGLEEMADLVSAVTYESESDNPMQWLDGLSAESDADMGVLEDLFADSAVWEDSMEETPPDLPDAVELPPAPSEIVSAMSTAADEDDPLGGVDPMLFLESLAKRQGVNLNELTTSADLEVEEVSADVVIDEPGYVPFEGSRSARRQKEEAEAAAQVPAYETSAEDQEEALEFPESVEWLDDLATQPGADDEEFLAEAALDFPELSEETRIEEPGYIEYSPISILPSEDEAEPLAEAGDGSLSWLEDQLLNRMKVFDMFARRKNQSRIFARSSDDPLVGLSDEMSPGFKSKVN